MLPHSYCQGISFSNKTGNKNCALKKWLQFHIQLPEIHRPLRWLFKMHTTPQGLFILPAFLSLTQRHTHLTISRINWISSQFLTLRTVLTSKYLVPCSLALNPDMKILNPRIQGCSFNSFTPTKEHAAVRLRHSSQKPHVGLGCCTYCFLMHRDSFIFHH